MFWLAADVDVLMTSNLEISLESMTRAKQSDGEQTIHEREDSIPEPVVGVAKEEAPVDLKSSPQQSPVEQVALTVPTTDDVSLPVWTFRSWTLGILSCMVMAFLNTFFSYRAQPIVITLTTALIATSPLGMLMASILPDKRVQIPFTSSRWSFSLNPGPFNTKEHTLISIFASAGSLRPGGILVVNTITVFFKRHLAFSAGFLFVLTAEMIAFSLAGLMQHFLVQPAQMWWPATLVNVSLVRALHKKEPERRGVTLIQFFYICLAASFAYYVMPGLLFPSLVSLSVLCISFPNSVLAHQLGSGTRGLGIGSFTFDWASISAFLGSPLVSPWFAVANIILGYVLQTYVLIPTFYWNDAFHAKTFPLYSIEMYNSTGHTYNVKGILTNDLEVDSDNFESRGSLYISLFFAVSCGITFATFGACVTNVIFFHGGTIIGRLGGALKLREEPADVHIELMKTYPYVPQIWYVLLFTGTVGVAILNLGLYEDILQMKWWGLLLGLGTAAILLLPIGVLVATTNQQPNLAVMSQFLMGYISPGQPIANIVFRTYSTVLCGRTLAYSSVFKLGHYIKIPPRATFTAQLIGTIVATIVSYGESWRLRNSINNICDLKKLPSSSMWTCPVDRVFYEQAIVWGLVGPKNMFGLDGPYRHLLWFFLLGLLGPVLVWASCKCFPEKSWLKLVNMPLIFQGAAPMPPAAAVNNTSWLAVASFFSFFVFMRQRLWWQRYNYILSAALDAGTVLMGVLLNYALDGSHPKWWGSQNDRERCNLASCPTSPSPGIVIPGCPAGHAT